MSQNYNIVELNVDALYTKRPQEKIFTFSRRITNKPLSIGWQIAHWKEIFELLHEQKNHHCNLLEAARFYFHYKTEHLKVLVGSFGLSLPELSLVIKQYPSRGRIFIPNISIKRATAGIYHKHGSLDDFLNSTSCNLVYNITQNIAANPDQTLDETVKNQRFDEWVNQYGGEARKILKNSLKLHPGENFVEGDSPDITLSSLNHPLYEDIAETVVLERSIEKTLEEALKS